MQQFGALFRHLAERIGARLSRIFTDIVIFLIVRRPDKKQRGAVCAFDLDSFIGYSCLPPRCPDAKPRLELHRTLDRLLCAFVDIVLDSAAQGDGLAIDSQDSQDSSA